MKETKVRTLAGFPRIAAVYLAGLICTVTIVLLPELLPAALTPHGHVWSPLRSMNYHPGDLYYYAAYVKELIDSGWPLYSPSAQELRGAYVIETWRFVPVALASLPGMLFSDIRLVIVAGYALSAAIFYSAGFMFSRIANQTTATSAIIGASVLFWTDRVWTVLPTHPVSIAAIPTWITDTLSLFWLSLEATTSFPEYDFYGNAFRYVNMSFSTPILLLFFVAATIVYCRNSTAGFLVLLAMAPALAFSYPSHALIAYMLLIAFCATCILQKDISRAGKFFAVGITTLIFLYSIDYLNLLRTVLNDSELWKNIFFRERFELVTNEASTFAAIFLNKYALIGALLLTFARRDDQFYYVVVIVVILGCVLSLSHLFAMPQLWARFLGRGIDPIWFLTAATVIADLIHRSLGRLDSKSSKFFIGKVAAIVVAALIFLLPAMGFSTLGLVSTKNSSRYLSNILVDDYRWLSQNTAPGSAIAVSDWEDIALLPVYTSATLVVGHCVIDGRSPSAELERFVEFWKFRGRSKDDLKRVLIEGPTQTNRLGAGAKRPFVAPIDFEASQFFIGVVYWPYINEVSGETIVEPGTLKTATGFIKLVERLFDEADPSTFINRFRVDYVMLPSNETLSDEAMKELVIVRESATRTILQPRRNPH